MNKAIEIQVEEVKAHHDKYILVDVREPHELSGPQGKIEGVISVPLGPALINFLKSADTMKEYVFICLRGYRSLKAWELAHSYGLQAYNMSGGMLAWNKKQVEETK